MHFCETIIKTEKGVKRHVKLRHGFQCDFCEIRFGKEYLLKDYRKKEDHAVDGYSCTICEYPLINTRQYEEIDDLDEYNIEELQEHLDSGHDKKKSI